MNIRKVPETPLTCEVRAALEEYTQRLMKLYPERFTKADHEAWREECRKKQSAGVRFEKLWYDGFWRKGECDFTGKKEDYREVPQKSPKVKEIGVGIPEAARNILKAWQAKGLKFKVIGMNANFALEFKDSNGKDNYSIPEQPIPEGMSWATIKDMFKQGLRLDVDANFNGVWRKLTEDHKWSGFSKGRLRIPAQPVPEKLLEVPQEISIADKLAFTENNVPQEPHAAERALWKAQREAGTNEVWQMTSPCGRYTDDIPVEIEPDWMPHTKYRVKSMKLVAKIVRNIPMTFREYKARLHDWEFFGTREEYNAECEKYGYFVTGKIKEVGQVKPKTVKYYFALYKMRSGHVSTIDGPSEKWVNEWIEDNGRTIIGNIETREVEV